MPYEHIWSEADVASLPADVRSVQLHRVTPEIVAALNGRRALSEIDLAGDDLDDDQLALLPRIERLEGMYLYGGKRITDRGFASILAIPGLDRLAFIGTELSEEALVTLAECPTLTSLVFDQAHHVTDRVIEAIGRLPRLRGLLLEAWEVTRGALEHLAHVPELRVLQLCMSPADVDHGPVFAHHGLEVLRLHPWDQVLAPEADPVVSRICGLSELEELVLTGYRASPSTLEGIRSLRKLRVLSLGSTRSVDSRVARAVAELRELRVLRLGRTPLIDDDLRALSTLTHLEDLRLMGCRQITGVGVRCLARIRSLDMVYLGGCTGVPMRDAEWLAEQLPDCLIQYPDRSRNAESWSEEKGKAFDERIRAKYRR